MALAISCLLNVALWQVIIVTNIVMKIDFIVCLRAGKHYVFLTKYVQRLAPKSDCLLLGHGNL